MREYTPLFIIKFMWEVSIVLCSLCKNSKIKGFGRKTSKNKGEKTLNLRSNFGTWTFETPLLYSNVPNWLLIRIWDFAITRSPLLGQCPKVYSFFILKASLIVLEHSVVIFCIFSWNSSYKSHNISSQHIFTSYNVVISLCMLL